MSLDTNIKNLVASFAGALKSTRVLMNGNAANNSALNTTAKGSLLAAINEVFSIANAAATSGGAVINDTTASTSQTYSSSKSTAVANAAAAALIADGSTSATATTLSASKITASIAALIADSATAAGTTWSSSKVTSYVTAQIQAVVGAAPAALDTLAEIATQLASDESAAASLTTAVANRIRVDAAQTFTSAQITQGQANLVALGMATAASVTALSTAVGDTTTDYSAAFTTALNS